MGNEFTDRKGNCRIISSKLPINYSFIIKRGELVAIVEEGESKKTTYYFNPTNNESKVTNEILERALRILISSNSSEFDILCVCFYGLRMQEEYCNIAIRVFKEHWNKLYNLVIADEVFGRQTTYDHQQTYDFFEEIK